MDKPEIEIIFDDCSYRVMQRTRRGDMFEIGYGERGMLPRDHAQNLYELCASLGVRVDLKES